MKILLFLLLAVAMLILVSGAYVFILACCKRKDPDWLDEKAVARLPHGEYLPAMEATHRWLREHNAKDVYTKAEDGVQLHALWIPAPHSRGTVLLAHGYRSTMLLDFHLAFSLFHRLGFHILAPEQRTHGESGGKYITFGVKESGDMKRWIDYHNQNFGPSPMILFGISMGASTVLYLADQDLPENVKGMIGDCGFTSAGEIISKVYRDVIRLPAGPSVWMASVLAKIFAGFSFWEMDTRKTLKEAKLPVLMIHGQADDFVPWQMTLQGYRACAGRKDLLLVRDAEHGMSFLADGKRYTAMVIDFIKENIPGFTIPKEE